jgi:hypothetical protein
MRPLLLLIGAALVVLGSLCVGSQLGRDLVQTVGVPLVEILLGFLLHRRTRGRHRPGGRHRPRRRGSGRHQG